MTRTLADRLADGAPLTGAWSMVGHPVVAEVLATEGFDFVVLDGEHSETELSELAALVRAVEATGTETAPVVRVSAADRAEIKRVLDFGPAGILVPQIESVEEAREAVISAQYPPEGVRGVAGGRASNYGTTLGEYVETANDDVATILQIETVGALDDLEDIVALDGLDALFVGPADLSARLGDFGAFEAEDFVDALDRIVSVAGDAGIPVGTLATAVEQVETRWADWEMDFLVAGTDVGYLRSGAATYRDRFAAVRDD